MKAIIVELLLLFPLPIHFRADDLSSRSSDWAAPALIPQPTWIFSTHRYGTIPMGFSLVGSSWAKTLPYFEIVSPNKGVKLDVPFFALK